jgi:nucleoredoxin
MTSRCSTTLKDVLSEIQKSIVRWNPDPLHSEQLEEEKTKNNMSPILALYFSSAWCDDSQASHQHVANVFQAQYHQQDYRRQQSPSLSSSSSSSSLLDLVYVSSDTSSEELTGNLEAGWHYIPFDEEDLRSTVKRYFGICAKKEMETLEIVAEHRKGGIPTLILIDLPSQRVLHEDAIPHIMGDTKLEDPLSHWASLLTSMMG